MRILITGSEGNLGNTLRNHHCYRSSELISIDKKNNSDYVLDLCDYESTKKCIQKYRPNYIFHFAAETNVDICQMNPVHCINHNYMATKNVVDIADKLDITIIFISSASVFNGRGDKFYSEEDELDPINYYGFSKLLCEEYIKKNIKKYFIFRFGWLVGNPSTNNKFIGSIYNQLKNGTSKLIGVNDQYGSLTFADLFIEDLPEILSTNLYGIYNYACEGAASRFQILNRLIHLSRLENKVEVKPVSIKEFNLKADRPENEVLDVNKVKSIGAKNIFDWEISLERFHDKYQIKFNE